VLDYNGGDITLECVRSFLDVSHPSLSILVVDNGSTDRKVEECRQWPRVELLSTGTNLGYAGGNNVGIRHALAAGAAYVLVANNDVVVTNPRFVGDLVSFLEGAPHIGYVGPKVWFREPGNIQNTLCLHPNFLRSLWSWPLHKLGRHGEKSGHESANPEVLNGVCILLRRSFLEQVGLFDEDIFMYREDTDLAIRARQHGWELAYAPVESVVHLQKPSGYDYLSMVNFLLKRNAVYVYAKHGNRLEAWLQGVAGLTLSILRGVGALLRGRSPGPYWQFVARLRRANRAALKLQTKSADFGPPSGTWARLPAR
jgi:GT2 family glycosyltransferase